MYARVKVVVVAIGVAMFACIMLATFMFSPAGQRLIELHAVRNGAWRHRSRTLRAYGFRQCPWMLLRADRRYPRRRLVRPPSSMVQCLRKLSLWQNRGDLVFRLMEGQGLGAQTAGGFHGNSDDDDVDMTIWSRTGVDRIAHYGWCPGTDLGSFGYVELPPGDNNTALFNADIKSASARAHGHGHITTIDLTGARDTDISDSCIGEWEGIGVLLPKPEHGYFRNLHGGSYWVPPVQGGKELGWRMRLYMDPSNGLFKYFEKWMMSSLEGLEKGVDTNGDQSISSAEFMKYVQGSPKMNQKWLRGAIFEMPCVIADAIVHYQHVMQMGTLMRTMRAACRGGDKPCQEKNWVKFNATYGEGPRYFDEGDAEGCSAKLRGGAETTGNISPSSV
jgi:hypothetical protein